MPPEEMMRLVWKESKGRAAVRVYWSYDQEEFNVRLWCNGSERKNAMYFTPDRDDAIATAKAMLSYNDCAALAGLAACGCEIPRHFGDIVDPDEKRLWDTLIVVATEAPPGQARAAAEKASEALREGPEALRGHLLYLLNAMKNWTGPRAASVREILEEYAEPSSRKL